ncbi:MAG: TIGR03936 family radical SAM-associated protein [Clostridium chrysemydis]|uniref:TIGR03936 family radical SAM-associated protein n=1 Tax=Clostridium chrysemydis TaxID=2665504 RepID=UPI003F3C88D5
MRYLIKFTKEPEIKFIGHLDLMRTIQRIIRRSEIPVEYSKGFNPHMSLSMAQPLSVGVYSSGEYMDLVLTKEVDTEEVIEKLNKVTARGVKFLEASKVYPPKQNEKKFPQAMALIDAAKYTIKIEYDNLDRFEEEMKNLLSAREWIMTKKTKRSEKDVDIRPMVHDIKYWTKDSYGVFNVIISSGSRAHLSADLFSDLIKKHTTGVLEDQFIEIRREEMYIDKNGSLIPLYKCI